MRQERPPRLVQTVVARSRGGPYEKRIAVPLERERMETSTVETVMQKRVWHHLKMALICWIVGIPRAPRGLTFRRRWKMVLARGARRVVTPGLARQIRQSGGKLEEELLDSCLYLTRTERLDLLEGWYATQVQGA